MPSKTIIEALYMGDINANARHCTPCTELKELNLKIEQERRYLMDKLSPEDRLRLDRYESLYLDGDIFDQQDSFAYGLKLGVLLMCEIFLDENWM